MNLKLIFFNNRVTETLFGLLLVKYICFLASKWISKSKKSSMSKKGLTPKWFFILVVTATLLSVFMLCYHHQCLLWTVGSKGISVDLWRDAAFPKRVWIYANKLYILNFFKNTEPNWFDLQLVRARFKFFLNLKTHREHLLRMQFFFCAFQCFCRLLFRALFIMFWI